MSSSSFNTAVFVDKLSKLNASQQSIETLSNWCIFHRKRAHQLVATWQDRFFSVAAERRLPLLYLCNDIIQNSRKKGPEFVAEFWTALPSVLQELVRVGPENARKAAYRIVDIWEDRKVFGHKDETLRVLLLGPELATPALASAAGLTAAAQEPPGQALKGGEGPSTGASTGATKGEAAETSRRPSPGGAREQADEGVPSSSAPPRPPQHQDSSPRSHSPSHRPKVRGALERLANAYSAVQDSAKDEETALRRCSVAVNEITSLEREARGISFAATEEVWAPVRDRLDTKLALLGTCCEQMSACETKRAFLVKLLQEALSTQESKLDRLRSQLQVGRAHAEQLSKLRARIPSAPPASSTLVTISAPASSSAAPVAHKGAQALPSSTMGSSPAVAARGPDSNGPLASASAGTFASVSLATASAPSSTSGEELMAQKRQVAAQLAAKVRASTSSAAILSQVLSNLAAKGASMAATANIPPKGASMAASAGAASLPAPSPPQLASQEVTGFSGHPSPHGASGVPFPAEKKPRLEPHPGAPASIESLQAPPTTPSASGDTGPPGFGTTPLGGLHPI